MLPDRIRKVFLISADGAELIKELRMALGLTSDTAIAELGLRALAKEKSRELARVKRMRAGIVLK